MPGGSASSWSASEGGSASRVGAASGGSSLAGRSASEEGVCICGVWVCLQVVEVLHGRGGVGHPPKSRKAGGMHLSGKLSCY